MLDQFRWNLISPGETVLAAVSGGPDSLCLLHLLWTARDARQIRVAAAHLDHGLRGAEAASEAVWVENWCRERDIVCHLGREDVAAYALKHKQSKQEAARAVRYAFLERTGAAIGADKIATGHTQNDQIETVLANILRGTGLDGLRGIPERRGLIVRPLIGVTRAEIEAYCTQNGLSPRRDLSNDSPDYYTRNKLRLELLPQLRRGYNAQVDDALLRLSEIAGRDSNYLAVQAEDALANAILARDNGGLTLDRAALTALHPALLRYAVRQAIEEVRGTSSGITHAHIENICAAVVSGSAAAPTVTLPTPRCMVRLTEQILTLTLAPKSATIGSVLAALPVPGEVTLPELGWTVVASWTETHGAVRIDADAIDLPSLTVRNRRTGDKIDPLGMGGRHKKVSDIFTDAKTPRTERESIPIVADALGIIWIAGLVQSERAKVTADTASALYLSAQETKPGKKRQEITADFGNTKRE